MSKFTFINEQFDYDEYTGEQRNLVSKTTREFHGHTLEGVLDEMTSFLRGAGYHFDGHLDVVSYEHEIDKLDEQIDELRNDEQSQRVFSHMVNDLNTNPIKMNNDNQYSFNFDTMIGSNPDYSVNINDDYSLGDISLETMDISTITSLESFDISSLSNDGIYVIDSTQIPSLSIESINLDLNEYCSVCKLPMSVMTMHRCYDSKCPMQNA